ncbi:copper chaperone PCu(A)C [Psychromonas sp. MME2]|uniref:copper chaperone PCu(A)C n=1 Tax=unclassified Psychromonas TaxID=2614957 RepID=UPI00339C1E47
MKIFNYALILASLLLSNTLLANTLTVDNAYVRATPPHAQNSAAFMVISNSSEQNINLVSASSDIAERVELHTHIMQDGLMKMRQVAKIEVPAKQQAILQPGGLHIMFIGLKEDLKENKSVIVKLLFDNGEEMTINAPIKKTVMHKNKTN